MVHQRPGERVFGIRDLLPHRDGRAFDRIASRYIDPELSIRHGRERVHHLADARGHHPYPFDSRLALGRRSLEFDFHLTAGGQAGLRHSPFKRGMREFESHPADQI